MSSLRPTSRQVPQPASESGPPASPGFRVPVHGTWVFYEAGWAAQRLVMGLILRSLEGVSPASLPRSLTCRRPFIRRAVSE